MRKFITALLAVTLVLGMFGTAFAATDSNTLVVGTPAMNGDFIEDFGNSAYDASIKRILHRYMPTVAITTGDELMINPTVVKDYKAELDEAGNKTYTFTICDDLFWSDGSQITANDYVFGILFRSSPQWLAAGGVTEAGYGLLGYMAYKEGVLPEGAAEGDAPVYAEYFTGVKLIDDLTFSATIDAEELPYFYELNYAGFNPDPMAVYGPELKIVTTEQGSKLEGDVLAAAQKVSQTERFAPTVVSGPYKFVKFENQTVTLEINEYFKGDYTGKKPTIQYIEQRFVPQDTDVDMLIAGDLDLVAGVIEGAKIEAAKAATTAVKLHSYLRNGYGQMAMHCDWGVTKDVNVRWALAYLIDRNSVLDYVLGGYGGIVQGEYGYAQWMYEQAGAELEDLLTPFNLNVDKANEFLDQTEWKFEADGTTPFDASKATADGAYMRYNDKGEMLTVKHLGTVDNPVTDIVEIQFVANSPLAGIKFEVTKGDFDALLANYYYGFDQGDDRTYNSFNLGNTFGQPYDPYFSWHSDFIKTYVNSNQLSDAELDGYIMAMRSLEPTQKDEFVEIWLKYQKRLQDLMPSIPLYSNEYFDIFSTAVDGMVTTPFASWDQIVCNITKAAPAQ